MILIDNCGETDPRLNLALEEFVFRNYVDGEYLLLYINAPSVILGKHQNVLEEVDSDYATRHGVRVVRRISGGGAVYHDLGNLNFSRITRYDPKTHNNYAPFLAPIIAGLAELGIESRLNNRNSLVVADGRKVSGNAQFASRDRMMSHGTLLFNSDLDALERVLNVARPVGGGIESHAVQSVRSRVVNIADLLSEGMNIEQFRAHIARHFAGGEPSVQTLSEEEWGAVGRLAEEKYNSWEWNIGRSPKFTVRHRIATKERGQGKEEPVVAIRVVDGIIQEVIVEGEAQSSSSDQFFASLKGERYEPEKISRLLEGLHPDNSGSDFGQKI